MRTVRTVTLTLLSFAGLPPDVGDEYPDEEEIPLKVLREQLRWDRPYLEWIHKITGHDVRLEELILGDDEENLGLYFRCEWVDPQDNVSGRTWETEITFVENSEMLYDYIKRHHKSIDNRIIKACSDYPGLDVEHVKHLNKVWGDITKAKEARAEQGIASDQDESPSSEDQRVRMYKRKW